jgi:hypothetical protein
MMMKDSALKLIGALSVLALVGCNQDPFPETGKISITPPKAPEVVIPPYVLDVPRSLDVYEGRVTEVLVRVNVQPGETAFLESFDLPQGSTFSASTGKFVWTPSFSDGNDPTNHSVSYRTHVMRFQLRSSANPSVIQRTAEVKLTIHDVPRTFEVKSTSTTPAVREGEEIKLPVEVTSEDFPQGPFSVHIGGLPMGATIQKDATNPKKFVVAYTPSTETVRLSSSVGYDGRYHNVYPTEITVVDPRGTVAVLKQTWRVYDSRLNPRISTPIRVSQGLRANFTVSAEDPNGEIPPVITIANSASFRGTFEVLPVQLPAEAGARPVSALAVSWKDVPVELNGTTATINVIACVKNSPTDTRACTTQAVQVELKDRVYRSPEMTRDKWSIGSVKYLRVGENIRLPLKIVDGESMSSLGNDRVAIFPESMRSEVKWQNGELIVTPTTAGFKQFNVTGTSVMGMMRTESFIFEALPTTWPRTLILGESLSNPEVSKMLSMIDGFQVVNPTLQPLDERTLASRETLILTTNVLKEADLDAGVLAALDKAIQSAKTVIVSSPIAALLTGSFAQELAAAGLAFEGRFGQLPGVPTLSSLSLYVGPSSTLEKPVRKVKLLGKLTDESVSPLVLKINAGSTCTQDLKLAANETDATHYTVGAQCRRANGGRIVVLGFELGDAEPPSAEALIVSKWAQKLVKP